MHSLRSKEIECYKWIASKLTNQEDRIPYIAFWIDIVLFQIFETLLVLGVSLSLGLIWHTVAVMIGFSLGRIGNIGYHAKTKLGCMISSTITFIGISYIGSIYGIVLSIILGIAFGFSMRK